MSHITFVRSLLVVMGTHAAAMLRKVGNIGSRSRTEGAPSEEWATAALIPKAGRAMGMAARTAAARPARSCGSEVLCCWRDHSTCLLVRTNQAVCCHMRVIPSAVVSKTKDGSSSKAALAVRGCADMVKPVLQAEDAVATQQQVLRLSKGSSGQLKTALRIYALLLQPSLHRVRFIGAFVSPWTPSRSRVEQVCFKTVAYAVMIPQLLHAMPSGSGDAAGAQEL
eukprot:3548631-Amphidinium_carterae.1